MGPAVPPNTVVNQYPSIGAPYFLLFPNLSAFDVNRSVWPYSVDLIARRASNLDLNSRGCGGSKKPTNAPRARAEERQIKTSCCNALCCETFVSWRMKFLPQLM